MAKKKDYTTVDDNGNAIPMTPEEIRDYKKEKRKGLMQIIKYALFAASAGLIQFVSFTILQAVLPDMGKIHFIVEDMDTNTFVATTVALALSILWNFTMNRKFTFKSAGNVPRAMGLAFLFYVPFYPFQTWYVHTVKVALGGSDIAGLIAEATVMLINGVLEFCWQKFFIYRKEEGSADNKYKVGEVGEFGEITPEPQTFNGMEIYDLLSDGVDINGLSDKELRRILRKKQ